MDWNSIDSAAARTVQLVRYQIRQERRLYLQSEFSFRRLVSATPTSVIRMCTGVTGNGSTLLMVFRSAVSEPQLPAPDEPSTTGLE
jgi:hypothetical protein